jgi:large subunit ribosomal protein L46
MLSTTPMLSRVIRTSRMMVAPGARLPLASFFSTEEAAAPEWKPKRKGRNEKRNYGRMKMREGLIKEFENQNAEHMKKAEELKLNWRVCATTIVERTNPITEDVPKWESDFSDLQDKLEYYRIHDWPDELGPTHPDKVNHDHEDMKLPFKLAPRETEADASGNMKTMERALKESVYFMVKNKSTSSWEFPQAELKQEEFLGIAAQRAIAETATNMPRLFHFKRQPIGYICQANDSLKSKGFYGTKHFFYSALVIDPYESIFEGENIKLDKAYSEVSWRTKSEVVEVVGGNYGEYLKHLLN